MIPQDTVWWLVLDKVEVNPRIRCASGGASLSAAGVPHLPLCRLRETADIRLLKCLRLLKVFRVLKSVEHDRFASLWRLSRLVVFYVMCIHW